MTTVQVPTSELVGDALDWAVAKAAGLPNGGVDWEWDEDAWISDEYNIDGRYEFFRPSTGWEWGGPIIDDMIESGKWEISHTGKMVVMQNRNLDSLPIDGESYDDEPIYAYGETILIAAMRAKVESVLGEAVEIPQELVK